MKSPSARIVVSGALLGALLLLTGCAKRVRLTALPLARAATGTVRVQLTYDRNNLLEVELVSVPDPSALNASYTRYVLWAATPDRRQAVNVGQFRVDENRKAKISTLTPFRSFILFITAETHGDTLVPGPDIIFESQQIDW